MTQIFSFQSEFIFSVVAPKTPEGFNATSLQHTKLPIVQFMLFMLKYYLSKPSQIIEITLISSMLEFSISIIISK